MESGQENVRPVMGPNDRPMSQRQWDRRLDQYMADDQNGYPRQNYPNELKRADIDPNNFRPFRYDVADRGVDAVYGTAMGEAQDQWNAIKGDARGVGFAGGYQALSLTDELMRSGQSIRDYGLKSTLTGKGNLSGFRDPVLTKAGSKAVNPRLVDKFIPEGKVLGVDVAKMAGRQGITTNQAIARGMVDKAPSVLSKLKAQPVNAGFAALNVGTAAADAYKELSGTNYNPFLLFTEAGRQQFGETEYEVDEFGNAIIGPDGQPIAVKGRRGKAHDNRALGALEAFGNTLASGGYDAFRANSGFADMAEMVGLGGQWSRDAKRNAREYVAQRGGAVDADPLNVGKLAEWVTTQAFNFFDGDNNQPRNVNP
jgi:hypothetical protein